MPPKFNLFAQFPSETKKFLSSPAHALPGIHVFPNRLHMITVLSNPLRYRSRYQNYWRFARHCEDSGAILWTVELAYGERRFEITDPTNPRHIQLRTRDELWHKENLINLGVQRLPLGVKYFGYADADFMFTRPDWAQETLHQLQHYDVVQMFTGYTDMTLQHRPWRMMPSFVYNLLHGGMKQGLRGNDRGVPMHEYLGAKPGKPTIGATGGAWAFRTQAFTTMGGMLDTCILGSADYHMAFGLMGMIKVAPEAKRCSRPYVDSLLQWQERARRLKFNVGYVDNHAIHFWHGSKTKRSYGERWYILKDHNFDPLRDVHRDYQGVLVLSGEKPRLRDAIRTYFRGRDEDDGALTEHESAFF